MPPARATTPPAARATPATPTSSRTCCESTGTASASCNPAATRCAPSAALSLARSDLIKQRVSLSNQLAATLQASWQDAKDLSPRAPRRPWRHVANRAAPPLPRVMRESMKPPAPKRADRSRHPPPAPHHARRHTHDRRQAGGCAFVPPQECRVAALTSAACILASAPSRRWARPSPPPRSTGLGSWYAPSRPHQPGPPRSLVHVLQDAPRRTASRTCPPERSPETASSRPDERGRDLASAWSRRPSSPLPCAAATARHPTPRHRCGQRQARRHRDAPPSHVKRTPTPLPRHPA